jgi:thiamine-phosphate pyrophosphorylase
MPLPAIQLVLNDYARPDWLRPLIAAGLDGLQVRVRDESTRRLLAYVRDLSGAFPMLDIVVNGRVDVALAAGIGGVHLAARGIPVEDVRRIATELRISRSVHTVDEAIAAERAGADAITFGHIFSTPSHPGEPGVGLDALAEVVRSVAIPVIAIGGIDPSNCADVRRAGASGIAIVSSLTTATDPAAVVRRFTEEWSTCD